MQSRIFTCVAASLIAIVLFATAHATTSGQSLCQSVSTPFVAPPPDFNPLVASDAELRCYGFPMRPTGHSALAAWTTVVEHAKQFIEPTFQSMPGLRQLPPMRQPLSVINENNPVWSGYDDVAQDNTPSYPGLYWTDAHAQWSVPTVGSSPAGRVLTWVGLGGDVATYDCDVQSAFGNTNDLCVIQAGTASTTGNPAQYYFWWEDFPYNQIQAVSSLSVSAGNQAYADASYLGNSQSSFFIENLSTNKYTSFTVSTPDVSLTSTDFILEEGYGGTGFTHFNTVTFASCTAQGRYNSGSVGGAVEAFNFRKITLVNNGTTYATPSWINSPTDGFSVSSNI